MEKNHFDGDCRIAREMFCYEEEVLQEELI